MRNLLFFVFAVSCIFSSVFAEDSVVDREKTTVMAGVGMLVIDKPHKGGDTDILPIPLFP